MTMGTAKLNTPDSPTVARSAAKSGGRRRRKKWIGAALLFALAIGVVLAVAMAGRGPVRLDIGAVPPTAVLASGRVGLIGELIGITNRSSGPCYVSLYAYQERTPGGWRELELAPGDVTSYWPQFESWAGVETRNTVTNVPVYADIRRPRLPSGTVWRIRFTVVQKLVGFDRLNSIAKGLRGRGRTNMRPWPYFLSMLTQDDYGPTTLVMSPEMTMP